MSGSSTAERAAVVIYVALCSKSLGWADFRKMLPSISDTTLVEAISILSMADLIVRTDEIYPRKYHAVPGLLPPRLDGARRDLESGMRVSSHISSAEKKEIMDAKGSDPEEVGKAHGISAERIRRMWRS